MSPTERTLGECRRRGWTAQVVERWNQWSRNRVDLFGVIDIVALAPGIGIVGIQACAGSDHATRRSKIMIEARARKWIEVGGKLQIWSWAKRGARAKRKTWTLREESIE